MCSNMHQLTSVPSCCTKTCIVTTVVRSHMPDDGKTLKIQDISERKVWWRWYCPVITVHVLLPAHWQTCSVFLLHIFPAFRNVFMNCSSFFSPRNYTGVISSIGALLIIDLKARLSENESYQCPFGLQSPQHPLISVLKQNKDTWFDVISVMQFICSHNEEM